MQIDARTIRAFVDGELPVERMQEIEARIATDETLRQRVAFERSLRERVTNAFSLQDVSTPAALVDSVRAQLASPLEEAGATETASVEPDDRDGSPPILATIFSNPLRVNYIALAACLVIMLSAVLVGILGEPFHHAEQGAATQPLSATAGIALREHERCSESRQYLSRKLQHRGVEDIRAFLAERVGRAVPLIDLSAAGYELLGAGSCHTPPAKDRSAHLVYQRPSDGTQMSIFVQPDVGLLEIPAFSPQRETPSCCIVRDGSIVYTLVIPDERDRMFVESLFRKQLPDSDN